MSKLLQSFALTLFVIAVITIFIALVGGFFILMETNPRIAGGLFGGVSFAIIWRYVHGRISEEQES